jgi:predicted secreted Zn-dependent protease
MTLLIEPTVRTVQTLDAPTLEDVADLLPGDEAGECTWNIGYSWDGASRDGTPRGLTLTVTIQIQLPEWSGVDGATREERREWRRVLEVLRQHEAEHEAIVRREVEVMLERMQETRTARLNTRYVREKQRIQAVSDAFDTRTDHGRRPPPGTETQFPS